MSNHGPRRSLEVRFWEKVDKSAGPDGCWLWTAHRSDKGYGRYCITRDGRMLSVGAHRMAYEYMIGPIPDGLVLDHLCRNPSCVNPAHLEPVTNRENQVRGVGTLARQALEKTHCPSGHPLTPENLSPHFLHKLGKRVCQICRASHSRASVRRKRKRIAA